MRSCTVTLVHKGNKVCVRYARKRNALASVKELRQCICDQFKISDPAMSYIDECGSCIPIEEDVDMYEAAQYKSLRVDVEEKESDSELSPSTLGRASMSSSTSSRSSELTKLCKTCYYCDEHMSNGDMYVFKHNDEYFSCPDCVPNKREWGLERSPSTTSLESSCEHLCLECISCHERISRRYYYIFKSNTDYAVCKDCIKLYDRKEWLKYTTNNTAYIQYGSISDKVLARRFSAHNVTCHHCLEGPIHGVRYVWKQDNCYNLCRACYKKSDKRGYQRIYFPWTAAVPVAPLNATDSSVCSSVLHLQMLLTKLGFMSLSDTDRLQGSFQWRTARSVAAFRKTFGVNGGDMDEYDMDTANALHYALLS